MEHVALLVPLRARELEARTGISPFSVYGAGPRACVVLLNRLGERLVRKVYRVVEGATWDSFTLQDQEKALEVLELVSRRHGLTPELG